MALKDLLYDAKTNTFSHSKLWSNIGLLVLSLSFGWYSYQLKADWELFLIYGLLVTYPRQLKNYMGMRFGVDLKSKDKQHSDTD